MEPEGSVDLPAGPAGAPVAETGAPHPDLGEPAERPELHERCAHHGARPAVDRCDACGEPICLGCAIPVRGRVLGPGCVSAELGDPALAASPEPDRTRRWPAVVGAAVAALATIGPWTRTGAGDRPFGAWIPTMRWSLAAGAAAIVLLALAWRWARRDGSTVPLLVTAGVAVLASALAIAFPPTFQAASWGPWACGLGAAAAAAGAAAATRTGTGSTQGV